MKLLFSYFMRRIYIFICVLAIIVGLFFILYLVRAFSVKEVDDVSSSISCSNDILMKSQILWVIPNFNNKSIAEDIEWCNYILSLNKTLGLHGVHHSFNEFNYDRDVDYLNKGVMAFEKCFGFKPRLFKAPQLALSKENKKLIENQNFIVKSDFNQLIHKVYHCSDTGRFSNKFINIF